MSSASTVSYLLVIAAVFSTVWFIVSAFRGIVPSQRTTANLHARVAGRVALLSFAGAIAFNIASSLDLKPSASATTPKPTAKQTSVAQVAATPSADDDGCAHGDPVAGRFVVTKDAINFRSGPGTEYEKVIDAMTSYRLGKTEYQMLGTSMVLEGRCRTDEWLQVKVIENEGRAGNWGTGWVNRDFVATQPKPTPEPHCPGGADMAYVMSQKFVKRELTSPSSASFPWATDQDVIFGRKKGSKDCTFVVRAWFDADNAFGAALRSRYQVVMHYDPKSNRWSARDLAIGQ